ncbi:BRCA2 and CDKN1A-interacting protein isoform X2 [Protopterus annectens]|uniref:BRCA2 and CDKN1A-interacting protein isoform X2 n=1 Tax=Protopterus annectens TaxID=7888 RepID=UPI001CFB4101|nr:BRCA2 and CDKN1A-interacting protein isoform X2 [Protopterus annectens]
MASQAKRRALEPRKVPEDDDDSGEEDMGSEENSEEDSEDDEEDINEEVNVEFEAHSISDMHHDGIKKLLQQLFLKAKVDTGELTDIIIQQNHIGSVIMDTEIAEQIKELILNRCQQSSPQLAKPLEMMLNDSSKPVGLLLSERFINVPPQIALPMHKQLQKELADAQKTNKPCGKCHYYLLISKTLVEASKSILHDSQQQKELMFVNAEEEFFYEHAALKFNYSVQDECDTGLGGRWTFQDAPMKPFRTVMIVPVDKLGEIMEKLTQYLSL